MNPNHLDSPLVAGRSIGNKPCLLHVTRWDIEKTKKVQVHVDNIFLTDGVCNFFCGSYHTDVCLSDHFSGKFGFSSISYYCGVKLHDPKLKLTRAWLSLCVDWTLISLLHTMITAAQTTAPSYKMSNAHLVAPITGIPFILVKRGGGAGTSSIFTCSVYDLLGIYFICFIIL